MADVPLTQAHYLLCPMVTPLITAKRDFVETGMPAAWVMPASMDPPLFAVSLSPERFTYRIIIESGFFAINLLDIEHVEKLSLAGDVSGRFLREKLREVGFTPISTRRIPGVAVAEALAVIECKLEEVLDVGGDHDLLIGRAVDAYARRAFDGGIWNLREYKPVLYVGRKLIGGREHRVYSTTADEEKRIPMGERWRESLEARRVALRELDRLLNEASKKLKLDGVDVALMLLEKLKRIAGRRRI